MTVERSNIYSGPYVGNGVTTAFPFDFEAASGDEVRVELAGVAVSPAAYTVAINDDRTGTVDFISAPVGAVVLFSDPLFTQEVNFEDQGPFYQASVNEPIDRAAIRDLYLKDKIDRAPVIPFNGGVNGLYPIVLPDGTWGWSSGGGADASLRTDLAGAGGASLLGYQGQTVAGKLAQIGPSPADVDATAPLGVNDARAAMLACDALGPWALSPGIYRVASNLTVTKHVRVQPGARFDIPSGVTVTFAGGITAGPYQIFNLAGTGAVAGLNLAHAQWFMGDISSLPGLPVSVTLCDTLWLKAFNAVQGTLSLGGVLLDGRYVRLKGAVQINPGYASYDGNGATYLWNSSVTVGFNVSAGPAGYIRGFEFRPQTDGTIPTAGTAALVGRTDCDLTDFRITDAYAGVDIIGGVTQFIQRFRIDGSLTYGLRNKGIDCFISGGRMSALSDWITLSGITGTFALGDAIAISGSVGYIATKLDATRYRMFFNDKLPSVGAAITSSSGGAATIASATIPHQAGGWRTEGNVEAVMLSDLDILGGLYSRRTESYSGTVGRTGNMYGCAVATSVYFDSSYLGAYVDGMASSKDEAWYANARDAGQTGVQYLRTSRCTFGGRYVSNSGRGASWNAQCIYSSMNGYVFDGNCRNYSGGADWCDMKLMGAIQYFAMGPGFVGFQGASGTTPPKSISIDGGSDYLRLANAVVPAGSLVNNSTGTHNTMPS